VLRRFVPHAVLFGLALWLLRLYEPFDRPITIDNQLYFYVAERVAAGVPPHLSLVDHKHALSAMLSGWAMWPGRVFGLTTSTACACSACSSPRRSRRPCGAWRCV
jgi:hypothetical protein